MGRLLSAGVIVQPVHLTGRCAFPGCPDASCRTSRLTPVGSNWLGGAEHYQPHCLQHHTQMDIFHAPNHLLHDTDWYLNHIDALLHQEKMTIKEFAKAANTAIISLRRQLPMKRSICTACNHAHWDEGRASEWTNYIHICNYCNYTFDDGELAVCNPLAIYQPTLHPQSGRLLLSFPPPPPLTSPDLPSSFHPPSDPPPPSSRASDST